MGEWGCIIGVICEFILVTIKVRGRAMIKGEIIWTFENFSLGAIVAMYRNKINIPPINTIIKI